MFQGLTDLQEEEETSDIKAPLFVFVCVINIVGTQICLQSHIVGTQPPYGDKISPNYVSN